MMVINFSKQRLRKQRKRDLMVLILCWVLVVIVGREVLLLQKEAETRSVSLAQQNASLQIIEVFDPEQQKLARTIAKSLNVPWYELLAALESIKQANPDVFLTAVLPDARKNEVIIKGQVARLDLLLLYIDALNQHPLFNRALPVSQQQLVPVSGGMEFILKVGWNHE